MTDQRRLTSSHPPDRFAPSLRSKRGGHAVESSRWSGHGCGTAPERLLRSDDDDDSENGDGNGDPPAAQNRRRRSRVRRRRTSWKANSTNSSRPRASRTAIRSNSRSRASPPGRALTARRAASGVRRPRKMSAISRTSESRFRTARQRPHSRNFDITVNQIALGSATLSWKPPTENADGSALTNLAGYRIYYGRNRDNLTESVDRPQQSGPDPLRGREPVAREVVLLDDISQFEWRRKPALADCQQDSYLIEAAAPSGFQKKLRDRLSQHRYTSAITVVIRRRVTTE